MTTDHGADADREELPHVAARFYAVVAIVFCAVYLAMPWLMYDGEPVQPLLLPVAVVLGVLAGFVAGRIEAGRAREPRRGAPPTKAAIRSGVVGLAGVGLVLARFLDDSSVPWVVLGMVGLAAGGAMHRWTLHRSAPPR